MNSMVIRFSKLPAVYLFILAVVALNVAKFWAAFVLGVNHQLLTLLQTILPIIVLVLVWENVSKRNITKIAWGFLFYHIVRLCAELLVLFLTDFTFPLFIGIVFSFLRVSVIFSLFMLLCMDLRGSKDYLRPLVFYFLYTTVFSILQLPFSPVSNIFISYGGNITSGNGLGIFRSNGGLGGTVIMYSNYLLSVFLLLFYSDFRSKNVQILLWTIFSIAVFLCFSRSLFLCVFIILSLHLCFKKPAYFLILSAVSVFALYINWSAILEIYSDMIGGSDEGRVDSWRLILQDTVGLTSLLGQSSGANTGFFIQGARKITADGFLLAWYYDYGLVGLGLLMALLWKAVGEAGLNRLGHCSTFLALMLMMFVNSGFDKMFILIMYFVAFMVLKNSFQFRSLDAKASHPEKIRVTL
jgi:hypothetical protein